MHIVPLVLLEHNHIGWCQVHSTNESMNIIHKHLVFIHFPKQRPKKSAALLHTTHTEEMMLTKIATLTIKTEPRPRGVCSGVSKDRQFGICELMLVLRLFSGVGGHRRALALRYEYFLCVSARANV